MEPTKKFVAARVAALAEIEADRFADHRAAWLEHGTEWLILRSGAGTVDFDIAVAEALDDAHYWREAVAWWDENDERGACDANRAKAAAGTPWTERRPVAVARSRSAMTAPPTLDDPWAFRFPWPQNRDGVATITAAGLLATPRDFEQFGITVELLEKPRRAKRRRRDRDRFPPGMIPIPDED